MNSILDELAYMEYGTHYAQLSEGQQAEIDNLYCDYE